MKPTLTLSPALLEHFSGHYLQFITLVQAGVISRATANDWSRTIWLHIYATYYSQAKAA
jgi:high-affinity Fe2+/Pb2+ permease